MNYDDRWHYVAFEFDPPISTEIIRDFIDDEWVLIFTVTRENVDHYTESSSAVSFSVRAHMTMEETNLVITEDTVLDYFTMSTICEVITVIDTDPEWSSEDPY
jgi:hypothetical protein